MRIDWQTKLDDENKPAYYYATLPDGMTIDQAAHTTGVCRIGYTCEIIRK